MMINIIIINNINILNIITIIIDKNNKIIVDIESIFIYLLKKRDINAYFFTLSNPQRITVVASE